MQWSRGEVPPALHSPAARPDERRPGRHAQKIIVIHSDQLLVMQACQENIIFSAVFGRLRQSIRSQSSYINMLKIQVLIIPLLLSILVAGCSNVEVVEKKDEAGRLEKYEVQKNTDIRSGRYERYGPAGKLLEEATYKNGKLEGQRKLYRESGELEISENYLEGVYQGKFLSLIHI